MDFPNKLVASSTYMTLWISEDQVPPEVWISVYMIPPIIFNLFNVRRYGEIEFWLTLQKILTFVLLIIYGLLAAMGASSKQPLSGTDPNYNAILCDNPITDQCVGPLGFNCISLLDWLT
jgi:amino acid permease